MNDVQFTKISWARFASDTYELARIIRQSGAPLSKIVAISRGGLVLSRILSDLLGLPVSHMTIVSYQDLKQTKEPMITEGISGISSSDDILLVDEISDSGKTFQRAQAYLANFPYRSLKLAALYQKSHTDPRPDFACATLDSWVIFPYEVRETYRAFTSLFKTSEKALSKMKEVGFTQEELSSIPLN